jgi:hypothetical protein
LKNLETMQIDFLVPGFSKCGTTTLCALLSEHPQIYIPPDDDKEPMYFILDDYERHWTSYCNLFTPARENQKLGEGSTFYSAYQHERMACDRIIKHNPDIKLIFIARDPIKRIESSYREFHHSGHRFALNTPFGFADAICTLPALIEDTRYWTRINCYRERLPDHQILVVFLEDMKIDPQQVLRRCYEFLGVAPDFINPDMTQHWNDGECKLYDTHLLRWLRNHPLAARKISSIAPTRQDRLFRKLGMRKPFTSSVAWDDNSRKKVKLLLIDEVTRFLAYTGRSPVLWPLFHSDA